MAISLDKILASLAETQGISTKKVFENAKEVRLRWPKVQIKTEEGIILHTNHQDWSPKKVTKLRGVFTPSSGYIQVTGKIPLGESKP